ncbi:hypothetical protein H6P81_020256 [Aristolochia fimbriata]|uniref:Uncharacterized protein n=1 Tax=Aristolochia fimbriata TaxID=158543 RepID=A0AAV7DV34_ARIFI|nr:hypothetical protein H6P81_020256 [Aristolochia fimbriata]
MGPYNDLLYYKGLLCTGHPAGSVRVGIFNVKNDGRQGPDMSFKLKLVIQWSTQGIY